MEKYTMEPENIYTFKQRYRNHKKLLNNINIGQIQNF